MADRRVLLGLLLPGAHRLRQGRWGTGLMALTSWGICVLAVVAGWPRILALPYGSVGEWVALATLVGAIGGLWFWSVRDPTTHSSGFVGAWGVTARAFAGNRLAVGGVILIGLFYLIAALTPFLAPYDPAFQGDLLTARLLPPGAAHPLGTDHLARDVLSRMLYGARVSLSIGFVAVIISVTVGTLVGAVAGYVGGPVDAALMRFVDMVISFPRLVLLITIVALFQPSIFLVIAVLGLTQWPFISRVVRGEVLALKKREFVLAAMALGYSRRRILVKHVLPNALAPVIVAATLGLGNTIVLEAGLSFLGLGIQPPDPSWGNMVDDGQGQLLRAWWISTFPGLAIVITVLAFNVVGDGLRDALDPRLRGDGRWRSSR